MPVTVRQRNMQHKAKSSRRKSSKGDTIITSAPSDLRSIAYPGGAMTLGLLLLARLISAYWNHIGDCDETFNYWEPLHYLMYGSGLQTWEYSPEFALRSYASLWLFAIPGKMLSLVMTPVSVFYSLRVLLAVQTSIAELMFYKAVCQEFGVHVGRMWLLFALPAAGCFASSAAMLPSAWSSAQCAAAVAFWWKKMYSPAVLLIAVSALLSWPFTALLGLTIAIDMVVYKRKFLEFFKLSSLSLVVFLLPMVAIDSWYYGRVVVAPLNIVTYNVFTQHGPTLYGVEPWTYYFVNGFLNFNVLWVLMLLYPVSYSLCLLVLPKSGRACLHGSINRNLLPLALWLVVFLFQPHKEERFLYPVYNLIILAGVVSLDCLAKLAYALGSALSLLSANKKQHYLAHTCNLFVLCAAVAGLLSVSRITQLYNSYHGTMSLLSHLPEQHHTKYVCYGKDWYRYPSSFHLGEGYRLRFVRSEFDGQMPVQYDEDGTRAIHPYFNDQNKGDPSTYLWPSECHFLVDSDVGRPSHLEPAYHKDNKTWEIIATAPILDSSKSHPYYRAFYVPFLSARSCVYAKLYLLRNKLL